MTLCLTTLAERYPGDNRWCKRFASRVNSFGGYCRGCVEKAARNRERVRRR